MINKTVKDLREFIGVAKFNTVTDHENNVISFNEVFSHYASTLEESFAAILCDRSLYQQMRDHYQSQPKVKWWERARTVLQRHYDAARELNTPEVKITYMADDLMVAINATDLRKAGDKLWVSVTEPNMLTRGVHELTIDNVRVYNGSSRLNVEYRMVIEAGDTTHGYTTHADGNLSTSLGGWNIFYDRESAVVHQRGHLEELSVELAQAKASL